MTEEQIAHYTKLLEEKNRPLGEIFHKGRLVGSCETLLDLMESTVIDENARGAALLAGFVSLCRKIKIPEDKAGVFDEFVQAANKGALSPDLAMIKEAKERLQELVKKLREQVVDTTDAILSELVKFPESRDPDQVRIENILKELDTNVLSIAIAHKQFNPDLVKHFEEQVELNLKSLVHYGIRAKTLAEAKEQYEQRFGGAQGQTVQDKIRQKIKERRRFGAELEADRAALVKEFPDQAAFINNEYRKEQGNLRKTL